MPYFQCRLATDEGRTFTRPFFAPSVEECREHFESEGFCVLSIRRDWRRIQVPLRPFQTRIKERDFILFNQELVALIKAGYPILKSIEIIASRVKNVHFKELLMRIEGEVRAGKSLSEAFLPFEDIFSKVYTASLMAGERSGNLAGTLSRYIGYAKVVSQTKSRIRSALTYPTLLLVFSFLLLGVLLNFVLPRFSQFYRDFEAELPSITRMLMSFALSLRNNYPFILGVFILFFLIYFQLRKKEKFQVLKDRIKLKIPYGGPIWLESGVSLFSRTLSLLLGGGISLLSSIDIARQSVPNRYLVTRMSGVSDEIKNGESLSESLARTNFFPLLALDMIRVGETSANLEGMLTDVAEVYDERIRSRIDTFVSLIEPVIIIFMGMIVAAMLLAVYLPIFNIIRIAR